MTIVIPGRILGCLLSLSLAAPVSAQSLPAGKGRAQFQRICTHCHGSEIVTRLKLSSDQWAGVVDDMVGRGAEGTDDDFELIVNYLSANFGKPKTDSDSKEAAGQKVNVNSATAAELTGQLEISTGDADAIVRYRKEKGAFRDWPDLRKVPGIDLKKLEDRKDRLVFTDSRDPAENPK